MWAFKAHSQPNALALSIQVNTVKGRPSGHEMKIVNIEMVEEIQVFDLDNIITRTVL